MNIDANRYLLLN